MKMKKVISALVIGATAAGIATADLKIDLGSKLAGYAFRYNPEAVGGFKDTKNKQLFDLYGYDGTGSDLKLTASGNIFTFFTQVGVKSDSLDNTVKAMRIGAKVGDFSLTTGWDRSGINNMSISDPASGIDKGDVKGDAYKLGSPFPTPLFYSNNQAGFGKDPSNYFAHAKYGFGLGDTVKLNIAAAVMSPHGAANSQAATTDKTGNVEKRTDFTSPVPLTTYYVHDQDNTQMGWGVNVNPVIGKIVSVELFAKGFGNPQPLDGHNFLLGGYAKLLCVPVLTNAIFGGSVWLNGTEGETTLMEWNVDLDLAFKLGDRLKLGFSNKFAFVDGGAVPASAVGLGSKQESEYLLWDVLSVSFKLNDTLTILGTVGQQTGFGDDDGRLAKTSSFTTVYVYPRLQVFATSASSVSAGVVATFDGLGRGEGQKMALLINVPFVVKVVL